MTTQFPIKTNFSGGEWSPLLKGRVDLDKYANAAETLNNVFILPQGGAQRRGGTKYIATAKAECRLVRFEFSVSDSYILEFSNLTVRVYKNQAVVLTGGVPVDVVTPYLLADVDDLHFTQSADTLYIVHKDHEPAKLTRTSDTSWTLTDIVFDPPPFVPQNDTATTIIVSAVTGDGITLTASTAIFTAADVDTIFQFKEILAARFFSWRTNIAITSGAYRYFGTNLYKASSTATTGADAPVHSEGTESDGAVDWDFVNSGFGWAKVITFTDTTHVDADVITEIPPGYLTPGYTKWAREQWTSTDGYPITTAFFEQRLWFAGSPKYPQRLWASISGDFENYTVGSLGDDSLEYTISSDQVNAIRWISPGKVLAVGTAGGEFILSASSDNEAVTPTNIRIVRESNYGSFTLQPVRPSNTVLFLQRSARKLRELQYSFELDAFDSPDLSLLAEHIIDRGVTGMSLQQDPQQIIHMVRADGKLISFTYLKDQEVNAWTRQTIAGVADALGGDAEVESVAILPAEDAVYDEIWLSVKRLVDGSTIRHIEVIQPGLLPADTVEDSFFVDAGVSFVAAADDNISNATYTGKLKDISPETTSRMDGLFFKSDGLKMYVLSGGTEVVFEYNLSVAWDVTSASYGGNSLDTSTQTSGAIAGLFISADGLNLIVGDPAGTEALYMYVLGTAWNISTASYSGETFSTSSELATIAGIWFKSDGLRMFVNSKSGNDEIHSYTLVSPFILSGATYDGDTIGQFDSSAQTTNSTDIHISPDGLRMTILDGDSDDIFQYTLGTAFEVASAVYDSNLFIIAEDTLADSFFINELEGKMFIAGSTADDVFQYSLAQLITTTIEGLDHLEGETVSILSEGAVIPNEVVLGGAIRLEVPTTKAHVGLGFTSEILTLDLEAGANIGDTSQGRLKRISELILRLYRTVGIEIGSGPDNTDIIPFRDSSMDMDSPVPLFTGDKRVSFRGNNDRNLQIYIKQDQPLPMTVIALMPKVKANYG